MASWKLNAKGGKTMNAFYTNCMVGKAVILALALVLAAGGLNASAAAGNPGVYTLDADFDQGTLVNVNHNAPNNDQLQLDSQQTAFNFIWVAASARGTVVKIDTQTGTILGEYLSAPNGRARNPSRTTVDGNGNVWTANRDEATNNSGSAIKIGLLENGQCVDRNGNSVIDTSTGLGNILPWPNTGGVDDGGGVSTATDECILLYQRLPNAPNARHVSVDAVNNVWVGGYPGFPTTFHKLDGATGVTMASFSPSCGGYGGLIDGSNVLWSAAISQNQLLRYDLTTNVGSCIGVAQSYGLGLDANGYIWNAMWTNNTVVKISPAGAIQAGFPVPTGGTASRGVVITPSDNHVWIANSNSNSVTRLDNNGALQATIPVGNTPTGVAVDGDGKVWVTNLGSHNVMRIDPAGNTVDLTVSLGAGAGPYNYSDMTGSTLIAPPNTGTWTVVHDSGVLDAVWGFVTWNALTPGDSSLQVFAASSTDGVAFSAEEAVTNGADLSVPSGQYLRVRVQFNRATTGESPILYDLTILANRPPDCTMAAPSVSLIWPPNHQWVPVTVNGVTDPDGDAVVILFTSIRQDEPVDTYGDGRFTPDGMGVGTGTAQLRAERSGTPKVPGNGRVYTLTFTATDPYGLVCQGAVKVGVPHNVGRPPIDDGPMYDSTALAP
jgi:YVTN family beta-propeller protein